MSKVSSGSLRLSGNAFQTDGLATENARQQSYDVMRDITRAVKRRDATSYNPLVFAE